MGTKNKKTIVEKRDYSRIPAVPLRILAYLIDARAYCRDAAVKITRIAAEIGVEVDEVRFDCQQLFAPGFAVLELLVFDHHCRSMAVYIETEYRVLRDLASHLDGRADQLSGRAEHLRLTASAMACACHPWMASDRAAPALGTSAG